MSWWVYLEQNEQTVPVKSHTEGGTYCLGGTSVAEINITYNYSNLFDFSKLNGKTAKETIKILDDAVVVLGTERSSDYWQATKGNVGYTCGILLNWAKEYPNAVWRVS